MEPPTPTGSTPDEKGDDDNSDNYGHHNDNTSTMTMIMMILTRTRTPQEARGGLCIYVFYKICTEIDL